MSHPERLRRVATALITGNLVLVLFSLTGTAVLRTGLPGPPADYEPLASVVAQASLLSGVTAALLLTSASQGYGRALGLLAVATLAGGISEWLSLTTGVPFGRYSYTGLLGPRLWGELPLLIPLAWFSVCATGLLLAQQLAARPAAVVIWAALLVTLHDLVLDPAMTTGFAAWRWHDDGAYYGVPLTNFAAWFAVSTLILCVFTLVFRTGRSDGSTHALWLYLAQGLLPAGLAVIWERGGASVVWAVGVSVLWLKLRGRHSQGGGR